MNSGGLTASRFTMKRKKRNRPRHGRAFETTEKENDPIERLTEWQEHRYDPGYYTGGNIHPLFTASRPNKYGYFLIVGAIMILVLLVLGIRAGAMNWYAVVPTAFMLFLFLVGFKLIKKQPTREPHARHRRRPSKLDD